MRRATRQWLLLGALVCTGAAGCSSSPAPGPAAPQAPSTGEPAADPLKPAPDEPVALSYEADVGAMDAGKVKRSFQEAAGQVEGCVQGRRAEVPFLGGEIEVYLRIAADGSVSDAFLSRSTLGDHQAEACILGVFEGQKWPRPVGGKEGETTQHYDLPAPADQREPVALSPRQLGPTTGMLRANVGRCRRGARTGPLGLTLYVGPDGKALSVGVAMQDSKGRAAVKCVAAAARAARFASPGSYPGKVSIEVK